jgi:general secretion pathway protein H
MNHAKATESGFTLLEIVCALAIVALMAAVLLPRLPHGTTRPRLEAYAVETASLLKADRNAAMRRQTQVATEVDASSRLIRSGATSRVLQLPQDVDIEAVLPRNCNESPAFSSISFFPTGMSCGGFIALTRLGAGYEIRVNWLTGGVEIVARSPT